MAERDPLTTFSVDQETGRRVMQMARRMRLPESDVLRHAIERFEQTPITQSRRDIAREWLASFDRRFPIPEPRETGADKAFFDDLSGGL